MLKFLQDFTKFRDSFKDFKTSNRMLNGITKVPEFIIGASNFDYERGNSKTGVAFLFRNQNLNGNLLCRKCNIW